MHIRFIWGFQPFKTVSSGRPIFKDFLGVVQAVSAASQSFTEEVGFHHFSQGVG